MSTEHGGGTKEASRLVLDPKSNTLIATIPEGVSSYLDIHEGDEVEWILKKVGPMKVAMAGKVD